RLTLGALCPFNVRGDVRKIPRCEYDRRYRRRRTDGWSDRRRHWSRNYLSSWRTQRRRQDLTLAQFFLDVFQAQTTCLRSCSTDEHLDSAEGDRLGGNRPNRNASLGYGDRQVVSFRLARQGPTDKWENILAHHEVIERSIGEEVHVYLDLGTQLQVVVEIEGERAAGI